MMETCLQLCNLLNNEVSCNHKPQIGAMPTSEVSRIEQPNYCHVMHVEVSGKQSYAFIQVSSINKILCKCNNSIKK